MCMCIYIYRCVIEKERERVCVRACMRACVGVCVCVREYSDIATNEYLYFGPIYTHIYI